MNYQQLLRKNPRSIGFGFLHTFFSGYGQTHFISLYSPLIMSTFALSSSQYGSLYSLVTLASGILISFIGPLIDRFDARKMGLFIGVGLFFSQLALVSLQNILFVVLGLLGLRLFGQGLSSSLSSITIARYFTAQRGKALALSQLGFPVFEGLMTPLGAFLLPIMGIHLFGISLATLLICFHFPFNWLTTKKLDAFNQPLLVNKENNRPSIELHGWDRKKVFKHPTVYFITPQVLLPPFALTGVFFHQAILAEHKGWSLSLMASGLFFFATGRIANTFLTGPLVDKLSAKKLFPLYQIPLSFAFLILYLSESTWVPGLTFFLFGLTVGSGGPIKSAIWAELYGVKHLGAIKSLFATFMIFSTAASPALFGLLIDYSNSSNFIFLLLFLISLVAMACSFIGLQWKTTE